MSDLKLSGTIHKIFSTQDVSASFKKRDFVIETDEQYPQMVKFELSQAKCDDIAKFKEGDIITVNFNVRGREWNNPKTGEMNYFNSLQAWRLEKGDKPSSQGQGTDKPKSKSRSESQDQHSDDLPF